VSDRDLILLAAMVKERERDGVLADDARREISAAWRDGRLALTAEEREFRAQPGLQLKPGEPLRPIERGRVRVPDVAGYKLWDWERSYAWRRDEAKNRFDYRNISAPRREFEAVWPPTNRGDRPAREGDTAAKAATKAWVYKAMRSDPPCGQRGYRKRIWERRPKELKHIDIKTVGNIISRIRKEPEFLLPELELPELELPECPTEVQSEKARKKRKSR
jgi:hypothetical protein